MRILTLSLHSPAGLVFFFIFAHYITLSVGTTFKRTIDDTLGDSESGALPVYDPTDGKLLQNSNCTACTLHPDPAGAFDHTWHDGSQLPDGVPVSVSLSFDGIAITLFCTLANNASEEGIMTSDFAFMLDGVTQKPFTHVPDNTSDFMYRVPVFSVTGLDRGTHNVVMATNNPTGSLMLFDFAQYT
ncbi:hypothetical protein K438DRAFT_1559132 [Mycena galopus ATCC 62051]|nr:hypothetical protein K438DRAFT_1559132 [Mycena galopus ATCC 62051]